MSLDSYLKDMQNDIPDLVTEYYIQHVDLELLDEQSGLMKYAKQQQKKRVESKAKESDKKIKDKKAKIAIKKLKIKKAEEQARREKESDPQKYVKLYKLITQMKKDLSKDTSDLNKLKKGYSKTPFLTKLKTMASDPVTQGKALKYGAIGAAGALGAYAAWKLYKKWKARRAAAKTDTEKKRAEVEMAKAKAKAQQAKK